MHRLLFLGIIFFLAFGNLFFSYAIDTDITTYQLEFRDISLGEAQDVINRSIGSGNVDIQSGTLLWDRILSRKNKWALEHKDAKILGGVSFYGPRGLVVAYEYYLQCGNKICGSIYEVFPGKKTIEEAMNLFVKGAKCLEIYGCSFNKEIIGDNFGTFLVPNATPVSIRLTESIPKGKIKFYHSIYAVGIDNKKVVSLDSRDKGIDRRELKKRLIGLVDFSMKSPTISLIYERSKIRDYSYIRQDSSIYSMTLEEQRKSERPYNCSIQLETSREVNVVREDNTFKKELIITYSQKGTYYKPFCLGIPGQQVLVFGTYAFIGYSSEIITGRQKNSLYDIITYLDLPL